MGATPANQYSRIVKMSQIAPRNGSQRMYGASFTRSGRVRRARMALTPGMIQLSEDARIVNHADAARLSLPSSAGSALGASAPRPAHLRTGNAHRKRKTMPRARVAKIAFDGAR